jgi:hypothetical protein
MEVYLLKELYATYAKQWNEKFKFAGLKKVWTQKWKNKTQVGFQGTLDYYVS